MARLFPWDFLEQFGYAPGSKSEATHYSTFGGLTTLIKLVDDVPYYWNGNSKCWSKSAEELDQITLLGEKEPNFRCGPPKPTPPKPNYWTSSVPVSKEPEYYRSNRGHYVGD